MVAPVNRVVPGHKFDILNSCLIEGHQLLATCDFSGEIIIWTTDQFVVHSRARPPGHALRAESEKPIECIRFMFGPKRHVLISVGADRRARTSAPPPHPRPHPPTASTANRSPFRPLTLRPPPL